jgi:hypothetical protein
MDFWEMIQKIIHGEENPEISYDDALVEYSPDMLDVYNYVITAHAEEDESQLTISFFKPEQWEMILATADLTGSDVEDIVRSLNPDEIQQMKIRAEDWNPEDGLDDLL